MPGATVVLHGGGPAVSRAAISDGQGVYRFDDLPPGTYTVTVTFAGGRPITSAPFRVTAGRVTKIAQVSVYVETVEVQAESDKTVETTKTTVGNVFKADTLSELPTGRSYTDVVQLAAGVSKDDGTGGVAAYGSTGLESNYQIDGMSSTSVGTGRPAAQVHFDIIKEISVKTGGYEAEFGGAQGALVNVLTKSGGNTFDGSLAYYSAPDSLSSGPDASGFETHLPSSENQEVAASLGGYFIKDRLFFYSGYARKSDVRTTDQRFGELFARRQVQSTMDKDMYFFKTTWQIDAQRRLVGSFLSDPGTQDLRDELGGPGGDHRLDDGGIDASLTYTSFLRGGTWSLEGRLGLHTERDGLSPTEQQQQLNPIGATRQTSHPSIRARCRDLSDPYCLGTEAGLTASTSFGEPSLRFGPYPYSGTTDATRWSGAASLAGFLGHHNVKFGVEYDTADFHQDLKYGYGTGMSLEWLPVTSFLGDPTRPPVSIVGVRRCWGDGQGNCRQWNDQVSADGGTDTISAFIQDSLQPSPVFTFNYGLRWDSQQILDQGGHSLVRMDHNFAPRLGASWDFLGNGASKAYASWGRYYDQVPMQVVSRAFSPRITSTRLYRTEDWSRPGFIQDLNLHGICPTNSRMFDQGT
ncbi:MAG TPA: carboxypeptidase regulatory-like domain-containing protein, partial [Candidatus Polarisedimenticolia bacterium]|nr:carboxypeptidase regulatory-like domain-containing protein [Candidatus Polarisedimenticolia bacterium]